MEARTAQITRVTRETDINLTLALYGKGKCSCQTGVGFLDHMLELFTAHGRFDLILRCTGDTQVDAHHSAEDIGIALGQAFASALGERKGITRYGQFLLPMDESLVLIAADLCGRGCLEYALELPAAKVGDFDTELVEEFLLGFVRNAGVTLHVRQLSGRNTHHIIEAAFKGLGRALGQAVSVDARLEGEIPSTKGVL